MKNPILQTPYGRFSVLRSRDLSTPAECPVNDADFVRDLLLKRVDDLAIAEPKRAQYKPENPMIEPFTCQLIEGDLIKDVHYCWFSDPSYSSAQIAVFNHGSNSVG